MLIGIKLEYVERTFFWPQLCGVKILVSFLFFRFMKESDLCVSLPGFPATLSLFLMTVITECQPALIKLAVPRMSNLFLFRVIHSLPHHTHQPEQKSCQSVCQAHQF